MFKRTLNTPQNHSFFLFGARGTGKSTYLKEKFNPDEVLWIDLLKSSEEEEFILDPDALSARLEQYKELPEWVVIDEVQKVPKLLDIVHFEIENRGVKFALTGSSARKLRHGGANLLAGRALFNNMFPLTHRELGDEFDLNSALSWGTLPGIFSLESDDLRRAFLDSYVDGYLKEEIFQEQLVRKATPFRKFLRIASQVNGTLMNFNNIAKDIGVDWATVRTYFEILEDTLLSVTLPTYDRSLRKQQLKSSKFYLFDTGVKRALDKSLTLELDSSQAIGPLFEQFIVLEIHRLNNYLGKNYEMFQMATQGGAEIDLILRRPGLKPALIEIKSSTRVDGSKLRHIKSVMSDYPNEFDAFCLCRESHPRLEEGIQIFPWKQGLIELGL